MPPHLTRNTGLGDTDKKGTTTFTKLEGLGGVVKVAAGLRHTVAVDREGRAWGWGAGGKGQLGPNPGKLVKAPRMFEMSELVLQVACGQYFTILIMENKKVVGHGNNRHGQLDVPLDADPDNQISCGWTHAVFLQNGVVRGWGRNNYHQLGGVGRGRVKKIVTGSEHCLVVTQENSLLAWGWNEHGNCGQEGEEDIRAPTPVKSLKGVTVLDIFSGSAHCFAKIQ